ncbi:MAG: hypothetical protein P8173_15780 [Gammaproteobacteria bacterium]
MHDIRGLSQAVARSELAAYFVYTHAVDKHELPHSRQPPGDRLWKRTEGPIPGLGIAGVRLGLNVMAGTAFWAPKLSGMIKALRLSNIAFGRAAPFASGCAGGDGRTLLVLVDSWIEMVLVLLFYPLLAFSSRKRAVFRGRNSGRPRGNRVLRRWMRSAGASWGRMSLPSSID